MGIKLHTPSLGMCYMSQSWPDHFEHVIIFTPPLWKTAVGNRSHFRNLGYSIRHPIRSPADEPPPSRKLVATSRQLYHSLTLRHVHGPQFYPELPLPALLNVWLHPPRQYRHRRNYGPHGRCRHSRRRTGFGRTSVGVCVHPTPSSGRRGTVVRLD